MLFGRGAQDFTYLLHLYRARLTITRISKPNVPFLRNGIFGLATAFFAICIAL